MTMKASWGTLGPDETRDRIRAAADQMGSMVRTTLGPMGRDKMVVRRMSNGDIRAMVTSDGIALIEEFEGETSHPIANRFIDLAEAQEDDMGEGTTMVVLLASELLTTGMDLIADGVHPTDVIEGFSIGAQRTLEQWTDTALPVTGPDGLDPDLLRTIAITGMTGGRTATWPLDRIADDIVDAVLRVSDPATKRVRLSHANTIVAPGGDVTETTVVDGAVIPEDIITGDELLPLRGRILLVEGHVRAETPKAQVRVDVEDPATAGRFRDHTASQARQIGDQLADAEVIALAAGGDISRPITDELHRHGGLCLRNVKDSRIEYLATVTNAVPLASLSAQTQIEPSRLGQATIRRERVKLDDDWIAFTTEGFEKTQPAVTILVRGGTERIAQEAERRIKHGKNALRATIMRPEAVAAGGAPDVAAAKVVRELAPTITGRKQLAVEAFGDVIESVPRTLAENAGLQHVETLATLRSRHDAGNETAGIDSTREVVNDITAEGGLDPFLVRTTSLVRAVEFATHLLRIDGTLLNSKPRAEAAKQAVEDAEDSSGPQN